MPTNLTREQIRELAEWHIDHFERLINQAYDGLPGIRIGECMEYRRIWIDVLKCNEGGVELSPDGKREVEDAIDCGDFDYMLGISDPETMT